jgi:aminomethyltransferase
MESVHRKYGAALAGDGIPLHYGDTAAEYHAVLNAAALFDRSHEGRLEFTGRDRLTIPQRMSTQDVGALSPGEGSATLFLTPNARILDRVVIINLGERALALTEPGRGSAFAGFLQRNIFFNDEMHVRDLGTDTAAFALHGRMADAVMAAVAPGLDALPLFGGREITIAGAVVLAVRMKPLHESAWSLIIPRSAGEAVYEELLAIGRAYGLQPAGSLAYNMLRIHAGRPAAGRELSTEYIPLEVGLWDEVSFSKGCYTGQEIIARMESRGRLARTMMRVRLSAFINPPSALSADGKEAGMLTSAVTLPDGTHIGIVVVRMVYAQPGRLLMAGDVEVHLEAYAGAQPVGLRIEDGADG